MTLGVQVGDPYPAVERGMVASSKPERVLFEGLELREVSGLVTQGSYKIFSVHESLRYEVTRLQRGLSSRPRPVVGKGSVSDRDGRPNRPATDTHLTPETRGTNRGCPGAGSLEQGGDSPNPVRSQWESSWTPVAASRGTKPFGQGVETGSPVNRLLWGLRRGTCGEWC